MALTQPIGPAENDTNGTTPADEGRVTPAMAQFVEIKAANPDCLLFYRMGDFYEMFFEDAEVASRALGIVLTKRGKYLGKDVPLCGVPVVRADEYLHRLIALGHRVAVCEQLEDPAEARKRGVKERGAARRDPAGDARARSPRTRCSMPAATTICSRWRVRDRRLPTTMPGSRWPGSISRPANSA